VSKFIYLLNAMENAASSDNPAEHNYKGKREAVLAYVRDLEAKAADVARDAERYRHIRNPNSNFQLLNHGIDEGLALELMDTAIDDAQAKQEALS